jgi:hypothetical protein
VQMGEDRMLENGGHIKELTKDDELGELVDEQVS